MKYVLSLAVLSILVPGYWSCKSLDELDQCAYEISFLANRDIKVPENDAEAVAICDKAKTGLKCLSDDAKECAKGAMKSLTIKVMNDLEKHLHTRCDNPDERAEFVKHVQCLKEPERADAVRLCADKHMVMMERVADLPKPLRLGGACCSSHALRECAINHITDYCSEEAGNYFNDLISDIAEENIELVCREFADLGRCDSRYDQETWGQLKAIMASEDAALISQHKHKTIVPLIAKMLKEAKK